MPGAAFTTKPCLTSRWAPLRKVGGSNAYRGECTDAPREVCEVALAPVNRDRVEAAYRRSDLFNRRRTLMQQWADYLAATA